MGTFRHEGLRLAFAESGSGPPLLLVHGLSGSRRWWRRNLPALEAEFTVFALDLVGFGASARQSPLPIARGARVVAAFMKELGIRRPRLVGHSMGGHTALHLAAADPDRVEALVLVASSGLVRGSPWRLAARLPAAGLAGALDFLPTLALDAARAGPRALLRATRELLSDDVTPILARVTCPTLLVWGERDVLVTRALGEALGAAIPGARLVEIPGAGHNVMYDRADAFNQVVLPFLRDPRPAPTPQAVVEKPA